MSENRDESKSKITGYIDKVEGPYVIGWAWDPENPEKRPVVDIHLNGKYFSSITANNFREDLLKAGIGDGKYGFKVPLPTDLISNISDDENEITLSVNNIPIFSKKIKVNKVISYIDKIEHFRIIGWAVKGNEPYSELKLIINGQPVEFKFFRRPRKDVAQLYKIKDNHVGFEIEIPSYIWNNLNTNNLEISIICDNTPLSKKITIQKDIIVQWIKEIFSPERKDLLYENLYLSLLTFEHLLNANLFNDLDKDTLITIYEFSEKMRLSKLIPIDKIYFINKKNEYLKSYEDTLFFDILRQINSELLSKKSIISVIDETILRHNLHTNKKILEKLIKSITPLLCKYDILDELPEHIKKCLLTQPLSFDNSPIQSSFDLSIDLSLAILRENVKLAGDIGYKLAKNIDNSWLVTHCIYWSVKHFNRLLTKNGIINKDLIHFCNAIIKIFNSFKQYWFSRLYDKYIIKSAVALIISHHFYPEFLTKKIIINLLRNFGLIPEFWEEIERNQIKDISEINIAHEFFRIIQQYFNDPNKEINHKILQALLYFINKNNSDAFLVTREILIQRLPKYDEFSDFLIQILKKHDETIYLRIFSHPFSNSLKIPQFINLDKIIRKLIFRLRDPYLEIYTQISRELDDIYGKLKIGNHPQQQILSLKQKSYSLINTIENASLILLILSYLFRLEKNDSQLYSLLIYIFSKSIKEKYLSSAPVLSTLFELAGYNVELKQRITEILIDEKEKINYLNTINHQTEYLKNNLSFFSNTLVLIYSCKKNLSTRIESIRKTWINDLKNKGIPYLIIVGNGKNEIKGDILELDTPDDYEYLPQKTLSMFKWCLNNTNFTYFYKIDDDCYLNVDKLFNSLTLYKYHYYGKVLTKNIGDIDRQWHQRKSKNPLFVKTFDKSPEPSIYCDGSGGYCLSRWAIFRLCRLIENTETQDLIKNSIMEDKLIGDLLSLIDIKPSEEEYEVYKRFKTSNESITVGIWDNFFFPCKHYSPTVVHIDEDSNSLIYQNRNLEELKPKKIFPTYKKVELFSEYPIISNVNQLELITDIDKTKELLSNSKIVVITPIRNEIILISHFLEHYRKLGITCFVFIDNLSSDGTREYILSQPDCIVFSTDTEYKSSHYGVSWQQAVMGNFCLGRWVLLVDADEFIVFENYEKVNIIEFTKNAENEGYDCIRADLVDMYPKVNLEEADLTKYKPFEICNYFDRGINITTLTAEGKFSNTTATVSFMRHRITKNTLPIHMFVSSKFPLFKYTPFIRLCEGVHFITGTKKTLEGKAWIAHFKYHGAFLDKVKEEVIRKQHFQNAQEYKIYLTALTEGKTNFYDPRYSVQFIDSKSFSYYQKISNNENSDADKPF